MSTNRRYIEELENLISNELLPAYVESQRRRGLNPNASPIISKLLVLMKQKKDIPYLLERRQEKLTWLLSSYSV